MDHPHPHYADERELAAAPEQQPPLSVSHFVHTIQAYSGVIVLSLLSVGVAYAIFVVVLFLSSPGLKITQQPFRLDFEGAAEGRYLD